MISFREVWQKLTFSHIGQIINLGLTRPLEMDDLPHLDPSIDPCKVDYRQKSIETDSSFRFFLCLLSFIKKRFFWMTVLLFSVIPLRIMGPLMLKEVLSCFEAQVFTQDLFYTAVFWGAMMTLLGPISFVMINHYIYHAVCSHMEIINILNQKIFQKTLQGNESMSGEFQSGDVVNLIGSDTDTLSVFAWIGLEIIYSLFSILAICGALYSILGNAALLSFLVMLLLTPLMYLTGKKFAYYNDQMMKIRDDRVSVMSQILGSMRIVKYFAWTDKFTEVIEKHRDKELSTKFLFDVVRAVSHTIFYSTGVLSASVCFAYYLYAGGELSISVMFSSLALFILLEGPFGELTYFIADLAMAKVSGDRVRAYLSSDHVRSPLKPLVSSEKKQIAKISNVVVEYDGAEKISDLSFQIEKADKIAILGKTGAGKSLILKLLLGEIKHKSGDIRVRSDASVAYVSQQPFIMNATIKENIIFHETSETKCNALEKAIKLSGMTPDIAQIAGGLETDIGEQGVNLSGGQKMRVSLARSVYHDADMILLDDPFAPLDHETENYIFKDLIRSEWADKTLVLVTHRFEHLEYFDKIILMDEGKKVCQGSMEEVQKHPKFKEFIQVASEQKIRAKKVKASQTKKTELTQKFFNDVEDREVGGVSPKVFMDFFRAMAGIKRPKFVLSLLVFLLLGFLLAPLGRDFWVSIWSEKLRHLTTVDTQWFYLTVFICISLVGLVFSFFQHLYYSWRSIQASKKIHADAVKGVLNTGVRFFDKNPVGRVLNRFSKDIDVIERELPWSFEHTVRFGTKSLLALVVIVSISPLVLCVIIPMVFAFYKLQKKYRVSARESKRLVFVSRSPKFAHFKESIKGLQVLRAYKKGQCFYEKFLNKLNESQRTYYGALLLNRWFSIRIPIIASFVSFGTILSVLFFVKWGYVQLSLGALAMTYSMGFWQDLNWCIRSFSEVEAKITTLERLRRYKQLPQEQQVIKEISDDLSSWPVVPTIEFKDVWMRYDKHLPDVIRGLSFQIKKGERVGIKGRTGSGKSSIFQILFRFVEAKSGSVLVGGVDIEGIPLSQLRQKMAIIPQDPVLFYGTLRENLDRFSVYSDDQIWKALKKVQLFQFVKKMPKALGSKITEDGLNISQGQRQLLCLARALLTQTKIIVMDEATASVDVITDEKIQNVLKDEFSGVTILMIAHRLHTLSDCDRVIELDQGRVII